MARVEAELQATRREWAELVEEAGQAAVAHGSRGSFSSSERGWSSWAPRGRAWPRSTDSRERCIWATMGGPS